MSQPRHTRDVIIVGGGIAGLSAAIYLGRARRDPLVIDSGRSMARWEPDMQNYLGFPEGISGEELLRRGRQQAMRYDAEFEEDEVVDAGRTREGLFELKGKKGLYRSKRLLLATGIFHIPPSIEGAKGCVGHSLFFCKDCDAHRVQGKTIAVYGWTNEAVEYALAMLLFSPVIAIVTDDHKPRWSDPHAAWIKEYQIPVYHQPISCAEHDEYQIRTLRFADGTELLLDALFTTRGDICFNQLAKALGAKVDSEGQILVNDRFATNVKGLYAAGCITPANCQAIIAAGDGATAAQAINRDLFEESLSTHSLRRFRVQQLQTEETTPVTTRAED